jgi:exopolysaccharide biosynthesis polyprenyl glycosylphosphotransferase
VLVALFCVWMVTNAARMPDGIADFLQLRLSVKNLLVLGSFLLAWRGVSHLAELYRPSTLANQLVKAVLAASVGSALLLMVPALGLSATFGYGTVPAFWLVIVPAMLLLRVSVHATVHAIARPRGTRNVLIVGTGPRAVHLYHHLAPGADPHVSVLGFVDTSDCTPMDECGRRLLGSVDQLEPILMRHIVDEVLIALPIKSCYDEIQGAIRTCERVGVKSRYLADVFRHDLAHPRYELAGVSPVVTLDVAPDEGWLLLKRAMDIVGSLIGLILFTPLMLVIALAIKILTPGPVLFLQRRYGLNKRMFTMLKFRTMAPGAEVLQVELENRNEAAGPRFKISNDPRITPLGRVLRRTSLDELPQLFNILLGDMSLVGPRPLPSSDVRRFSEGWLMRRFSVKPGLTGLWQVSGRCNLTSDAWVALDLEYIDRWSISLDCSILLRTFPAVLKGSGAV